MALLESLFGKEPLTGKHDTTVEVKALADNELIGLYFSAHWCPPCRGFTPKLVDTWVELRDRGRKFQIVFVSFDQTAEQCNEYYLEMPWLMVPFEKEQLRTKIAEKHGVEGIPALLLLDPKTLEVKSKGGREMVQTDPKGEKFPWVL